MERIKEIIARNDELTRLLEDDSADYEQRGKWYKEQARLEGILRLHSKVQATKASLASESDAGYIELAQLEIAEDEARLIELLAPRDERDDGNVIMEIRPAAGGDEAGLFAASLLRMYTMYAGSQGFRIEMNHLDDTEVGGLKSATLTIIGDGAFSRLKYESGVHRVQRVPETESQGRIHTSTATVAVLPESVQVDFKIEDKDIRVDVYRASGAGGQHVNKTESAIRITHLPTNTVVTCQDNRSQIKNREQAMKILQAKLADHYQALEDAKYAGERKSQVGSGDRSERIRTYNFPQGRVTDHRIGKSLYNMTAFMNGEIDEMIDALHAEARR